MFASKPCPKCQRQERDLLATLNEWKYYRPDCDRRYNEAGDILEIPNAREGIFNV